MDRKIVQVFYGAGKGKTSAAVGQCIRAASLGQSVIIIQFLKGKDAEELNYFVLKNRMVHTMNCWIPRKRKKNKTF